MKVIPIRDDILVELRQPPQRDSKIYIPEGSQERQTAAYVVAIGPGVSRNMGLYPGLMVVIDPFRPDRYVESEGKKCLLVKARERGGFVLASVKGEVLQIEPAQS